MIPVLPVPALPVHLPRQPPFLKWAGGKRWLAETVASLVPTTYGTYYEPFLGSGAIYFKLAPARAVLSDVNANLINTYQAIKSDWKTIEKLLREHHRRHSKEYYYEQRQKKLRAPHTMAAQFIYLNRTCWNGLYRVNLNGVFNVPIGTKTNVVLNTDDFESVSKVLSGAELHCRDFEKTIDEARTGDLVFADPPYTVHHNNNGFLKYNENIFSWDDQVRLRDCLVRARNRGATIVLTNANHQSIRSLYENEFHLTSASRVSIIAGTASARTLFDELLITSK